MVNSWIVKKIISGHLFEGVDNKKYDENLVKTQTFHMKSLTPQSELSGRGSYP